MTFRPDLDGVRLEDRVVLSARGVTAAQVAAFATGNSGNSNNSGNPNSSSNLTASQVRNGYAASLQNTANGLRQYVNTQTAALYANGATPTAEQLANFRAQVAGAVNAAAFTVSSQAALVPNATRGVVPAIQNAILGNCNNSLISRINAVTSQNRNTGSASSMEAAVGRQLDNSINSVRSIFMRYFNAAPLNRLSVDASGNRIGLQQYLGNRVISQYSNSLGSLANSFPNVAQSALFANGSTGTPSQAAMNGFNTQYTNALGVITAQLGNNLSLFQNSSSVLPQFFSSIYCANTGTGNGTGTGTGGGVIG